METEQQFQRIFANIKATAKPRTEKLHGEEYYVVPAVMLVEGVVAGSGGPKLYKGEDMKESVPLWNHKPLVINHPELEGEFVSACTKEMLEDYGVGMLLNTEYREKPNRLACETWFHKSRLQKREPGVYNALRKGKPVEVSTGLFCDIAADVGLFANKKYDGVVSNYRPDHLAILPTEVGACSVAEGAGLLMNVQGHGKIRQQLQEALKAKFPPKYPDGGYESPAYVVEVYETSFVYMLAQEYYSQKYSAGDRKGVELLGEPVEAILEYRTNEGELIGNSSLTIINSEEVPVADSNKTEEKVKALIESSGTNFTKDDAEWLGGLEETQLDKMTPAEKPVDTVVTGPTAKVAETTQEDPKVEEASQPEELEAVLNKAHPSVREVLVNGLEALNENKTKLIKKITANTANIFTEDQLTAKSLQELKAISALAGPDEEAAPVLNEQMKSVLANFSGRGGGSVSSGKAPTLLSCPSTAVSKS